MSIYPSGGFSGCIYILFWVIDEKMWTIHLSLLYGGDSYTFYNSRPLIVSNSSHCHLDFDRNDVGDIWCAWRWFDGLEDTGILLRGRFQSAFLKCSTELFLHPIAGGGESAWVCHSELVEKLKMYCPLCDGIRDRDGSGTWWQRSARCNMMSRELHTR